MRWWRVMRWLPQGKEDTISHLQVASEARQALHGHIESTGPRAEVWRRWVPEEEEKEEGASLLRWLLMLLGARWSRQASWHSITAG